MGNEKERRPLFVQAGLTGQVSTNSTGTSLKFRGIQEVFSTVASKVYNLAAPKRAGDQVMLVCHSATTAALANVILASGVSFQGSSESTGVTIRKAVFNSGNHSLHIVARSTSRLAYIPSHSAISLTTT